MKKKIIISIVSIILIVVSLYFCNQYLNLKKYDSDTTEHYNELMDGLNNIKTIELKKEILPESEYYKFGNIKIKNDFKNFKKEKFDDKHGFVSSNFEKLMLTDKNGKTLASVWIGTTDSRVKTLLNYENSYYDEISMNKKDIVNFFEKNNITNDIELFKYLKLNKDNKINIFTDSYKMKNNYIMKYIVSELPTFKNLTLIDDNGYMLSGDKFNEINFIKGGTNYFITIFNFNYFPDDYIDTLLNTLVIE